VSSPCPSTAFEDQGTIVCAEPNGIALASVFTALHEGLMLSRRRAITRRWRRIPREQLDV